MTTRERRASVGLWLVVVAMILGLGYLNITTNDHRVDDIEALVDNVSVVALEGKAGTAAVCAFRADLVRRVKSSEKLIRDNPGLIKRLGLTEAQVRSSINNQKQTVKAVSGVLSYCPNPGGEK
jgi:hypothetical protein